MNFAASVFLDGLPLRCRSFVVIGTAPGEVALEYVGNKEPILSPETVASWCGFADGALFHQPLAAKLSEQAVRFWCGDLDSVDSEEQKKALAQGGYGLSDRLILSKKKDISDGARLLDACYRYLMNQRVQESGTGLASTEGASSLPAVVEVIGAFGGRRDHERINLAEIEHVFFQSPRGPVPGAHPGEHSGGWVVVLQPSVIVSNVALVIRGLPRETPISLLSASSASHFRLDGLRYAGDVCLSRPSQGLSNAVASHQVSVRPLRDPVSQNHVPLVRDFFEVIVGHEEQVYFK